METAFAQAVDTLLEAEARDRRRHPRWKGMIRRHGHLAAVERLLRRRRAQPGLYQLAIVGRLDRAIETLVLEARWRPLWEARWPPPVREARLTSARDRLKDAEAFVRWRAAQSRGGR